MDKVPREFYKLSVVNKLAEPRRHASGHTSQQTGSAQYISFSFSRIHQLRFRAYINIFLVGRHVSHLVHLHVDHHVHLHVGCHVSYHGGHRNVVLTLCEVSETLTEITKVSPTYLRTD